MSRAGCTVMLAPGRKPDHAPADKLNGSGGRGGTGSSHGLVNADGMQTGAAGGMMPASCSSSMSNASLEETTPLATNVVGVVVAGAGDIDAAAGGRAGADSAALRPGHSVEQHVGATMLVSLGAAGATTGDATMDGARARSLVSPADAMVSSVASSELAAITGAKQSEVWRKQSEVRSIDW